MPDNQKKEDSSSINVKIMAFITRSIAYLKAGGFPEFWYQTWRDITYLACRLKIKKLRLLLGDCTALNTAQSLIDQGDYNNAYNALVKLQDEDL
jgi:hypothetical protein